MASKHVAVVGAAGYIGTVLCARLLSAGHHVRGADALVWGNAQSLSGLIDHPRFTFLECDIRDENKTRKAIASSDCMVMLAGLVGDPITRKYPEVSTQVNLDAQLTLIESARTEGIPRVIFASTCSNYGLRSTDEPAVEASPLKPLSLYAQHKVEIEERLLSGCDRAQTATVLRFATAYGVSPRMRYDLTVSHFVRDALTHGRLEVFDPDTWRPYCHVRDLSEAVALTIEAPEEAVAGEVFNVGSDADNFTKRQLAAVVSRYVPDLQVDYVAGGQDARNYTVSFEKISRVLGFKCAVDVTSHVERLVYALKAGVLSSTCDDLGLGGNFGLSLHQQALQ